MKYILILGNITFHHFEADELALFKTDKENKALIHDLQNVVAFNDKENAYIAGDEAESYIVVNDFTGEMIFENRTDEVKYHRMLKEIEADEVDEEPHFTTQDLDEDNIKDMMKWVGDSE